MYRFDTRGALLPKFLAGVVLLFIAILVGAYCVARQANPVILDEHGAVRSGGR